MSNAITNESITLFQSFQNDLSDAKSVKLIVSFLMESGAALIVQDLKKLVDRGVPISILTGKYLNITEPSAIYLLKKNLEDKVDLRFFSDLSKSFHPKAYFIEKEDDAVVYVGSSNLSRSALLSGVEWNFRVEKSKYPDDFKTFEDTFNQFFEKAIPISREELEKYSDGWKKTIFNVVETFPKEAFIQPTGAQIDALYYLDQARKEGAEKGLVVAATGVGKTYLSAFDSRNFSRVLFIAHKQEIIEQAAKSYHHIRPGDSLGFFSGKEKVVNTLLVFATIQTIGQRKYLSPDFFPPDYFDYIVVDEFHHAAAPSYQNIFSYFKPRFLLGLTATPYRMDNSDIFVLCDDNVIYEITLKDSINRGLLVPFHYYAIYDETDYASVPVKNGKYDQPLLEQLLSTGKRPDLILSKYHQFGGRKTLAFCAGIRHAEYMAEYFNSKGVPSGVVHSSASSSEWFKERTTALEDLKNGRIQVLFTVDMFNEGVDIPLIDCVMFLRPTESFVIFLQQLGRGLRRAEGKKYLKVLDFIGNYRRAHHIPLLLAGINPLQVAEDKRYSVPQEIDYPEGCLANFDFKLIDLFERMRLNDPISQRIQEEYWRLKDQLGRRPTRIDVFERIDIPIRYYLNNNGWLRFLEKVDELTDEEKSWLGTRAEEFFIELEKTSMSKSYKMPTLLSFLHLEKMQEAQADKVMSNEDLLDPMIPSSNLSIKGRTPMQRIIESWRRFYAKPFYSRDLLTSQVTRDFTSWTDKKIADHARRNPVHFLSASKNNFFRFDEKEQVFSLNDELSPFFTPVFAWHFKDIIGMKTLNYFTSRFRRDDQ
jgi:superfamily II DNA or RNA helicase